VAAEAKQQQQGRFGAATVGSAAAASATRGAAGRQDIGGSSYSRAVAAVAAWQRRCLHEGGDGSAEAGAG
jgi:hypothetical protein